MINKFLIHILCIHVTFSLGFVLNMHFAKLLDEKLKWINHESKTKPIFTRDAETHAKFSNVHSVTLPNNYINAHWYTLFNLTYALMDFELYYIIPQNNKLILNEFQSFPDYKNEVHFVKTVEFNGNGFLLVSLKNGITNIHCYINNTGENELVQSIENNVNVQDANFFVQKSKLYLIIATIQGAALMPTKVYVWKNSHFDEIDETLERGVSGLLTFSNGESEIILLLQNSTLSDKPRSIIYEFSYGHLKKMQILKTNHPRNILSWMFENRRYIFIFDELYDTMYWWDGSELVEIAKFMSIKNIEKTLLTYIESIPIIFVLTKIHLSAYIPTQNQLISLNKINVPFKKVFDLTMIRHNETNKLLVLGQTKENLFNVTVINFLLEHSKTETESLNKDPISKCFLKMEQKLKSLYTKLNLLEHKSSKILQVNESAEIDGRINVAAPIVAQTAFIHQPITSANYFKVALQIREANAIIEDLAMKMQNILEAYENIKGKAIIKGSLHALQLTAKNLIVTKLNSISWDPVKWWSYSKAQTIEGAVAIKNLLTKDLQVLAKGTIFEGIFQQNSDNKLKGSWTVGSLATSKLFTPQINGIPLHHLYFRSKATNLTGLKQFKNLKVDNMTAIYLNQHNASDIIKLFADPKSQNYQFVQNLYITNLHADFINGVNWTKFKESALQLGKNNIIKGSISIARAKIDRLYVRILNQIEVKDLLTTSTDQVVLSSINFNNIDARDINCGEINGENISVETTAISNTDSNFIKGPVIIEHFYATNLNLNGKQINGRDQSHFLQIYSNKVKIIGTLHLENATLSNSAKLLVNAKDYNLANLNNYWLKSVAQEIPVHVEMQKGLTTPQLLTTILNGVKFEDYMLNNLAETSLTKFHFQNAMVKGNVVINEDNYHQPNLKRIDRTAVKLNGEYKIKGQKYINGELKVDNLFVQYLDNVDVNEVVAMYDENISGLLVFEKIIVKGDVTASQTNVNKLNIDLEEVYNGTMLINRSASFDNLVFENVTVENLQVYKINEKLFNEYILMLDKIDDFDSIHKLQIIGNVIVDSIQNMSYFNGINVNVLMENVGRRDVVKGNAKFLNDVYVKDLKTLFINDVNLEDLTRRLFYRNYPQIITGQHSFKIIRSPHLITPQINNYNLENLINVASYEPQILALKNTLHFTSLKFLKSLNVKYLPCDAKQTMASLQSPPTRYWSTMHILENVGVVDEFLVQFLEKAVTTTRKNVITAPVTFAHIAAKNIMSSKNINNIDIAKIYDDALLKHKSDQIISGMKQFMRITAAGASVSGNIEIPVINKLLITRLNQSIIHKAEINNMIIRGVKTFFGGLKTHNLNAPSILGINPDNLVGTQNRRIIPQVAFDSLHILNNFDINFVNNINFTSFLINRLIKNCPNEQYVDGRYYFDDVDVHAYSTIPEINQIRLDDVIFDYDGIQKISSPKTFVQNVEVFGNAEIEFLNGINIASSYEWAVLYNEEAIIEGNIIFNEITEVSNNITAQNINGVPTSLIKELLGSEAPKIKANITQDAIQKIVNVIKENIDAIDRLPSEYMYLEKTDGLQIIMPNTICARVIEMKEHVMLHIIGEEFGYACGLPTKCNCLTQHTVQITTEGSIYNFPSKHVQRVYSFENNDISVHVATNSISSSEFCSFRSNSSNLLENGTLVWLVKSGNNTGKHFIYPEYITGFISNVEFFALDGYTYAVIGRFYDTFINSHNLDCLVFRFTKEMDNVHLIQTIPTEGLWALHIFHTAQGIHLIMGNIFNSDYRKIGSGTNLHRFDSTKKKFQLLRNIPGPGCISVAAVVLQTDSLIILAQRKSPLLVLKYNHYYDNYYLYQNFILDSHVVHVSSFYIGPELSDAYLCVVTENNNFYVYAYQYILGWKLKSHGELDGLRSLTPFALNGNIYLFAASSEISSVLTVVTNG